MLAVASLRARGWWRPKLVRRLAVIFAVAFALAATFLPRDHSSPNPLARAFARVPGADWAELQRFGNELLFRFGYTDAAMAIIAEHPISGIGVGAFHAVAPEYIFRETSRVPTADNAQNWWRHQLAELGIVGALPAIAFTVLLLLRLRGGDGFNPPVASGLRGVIVGVAAASLLGVPTQHPATWLSFIVIVFWFMAIVEPPDPTVRRSMGAFGAAVLAIPALVVAGGLSLSARDELRPAHRAMRAGLPYSWGLSPPEGLAPEGEVRQVAAEALWVIRGNGDAVRMTFWALHPDVQDNPVSLRVSVDDDTVISHVFEAAEPFHTTVTLPNASFATLRFEVTRTRGRNAGLLMATRRVPARLTR
jgi:hypothetical protein